MGKHIKRKSRPGVLIFVFMLWVVLAILTVQVWRTPLVEEETVKENSVILLSNYDYVAEVEPCTLYPEGGVQKASGVIFPLITEKLTVSVETKLSAEKPVSAQGSYRLILQLTAEDLWTKDFPLAAEKSFIVQGQSGNIIKEEVVLDLEKIKEFIIQVEKETENSRRTYSLAVKPELVGTLVYDQKTLPLREESSLQFSYESREIKPEGERNFSTDLSFEKKIKKQQNFVFAGKSFSLVGARELLTGLALLFLVWWISQVRQQQLIKKSWAESKTIDKKYGSRLIQVVEKVEVTGKIKLRLQSFQTLLQMAEEKEVPICRVCSDGMKVIYFVLNDDCLYYYLVEEQLTPKQVAVRVREQRGRRNIHG